MVSKKRQRQQIKPLLDSLLHLELKPHFLDVCLNQNYPGGDWENIECLVVENGVVDPTGKINLSRASENVELEFPTVQVKLTPSYCYDEQRNFY